MLMYYAFTLDSIFKSILKAQNLLDKPMLYSYIVLLIYGSSLVVASHSVVSDFATLWTVAYQAPPTMGFSRQEDWSGLP